MPPDAEELRRRTEEGKKAMEFKDLVESVNYDILEQTKFGLSSTVYSLGEDKKDFAPDVLNYFSESEVSIRFNEDTKKLHISWKLPEEE